MPHDVGLHPRFEVDGGESSATASTVLVDPEQYDATEERFSASLDTAPVARFIPDDSPCEQKPHNITPAQRPAPLETKVSTGKETSEDLEQPPVAVVTEETRPVPACDLNGSPPSSPSKQTTASLSGDSSPAPDTWKEEVAARLSSYRARRKPRPPKYPSLSLDFEPVLPATYGSSAAASDSRMPLASERQHQVLAAEQNVSVVRAEEVAEPPAVKAASARLIEFPRFFTPAEVSPDELAEPVCEHPRILDAPEVEVPPPALGGIVLESTDDQQTEERPGFEMPLRSAAIAQRVFAALIDATVIMANLAMFGCIFLRLAKVLPPVSHLLASAVLVATVFWAGYEYMLFTYCGTTPGLRLAKLQLIHFDGSAVARSRRRWRVLASLLSAVSLGLGFAWCFLDEDALCWHDRITRTHLVPRDRVSDSDAV
ncbi:MAG TPA: RDD family protein [Terriglobales bacterium]|nr:RDD family protein [Terriglobales bacterium]